eukprot:IDg18465t1
MQRGRVPELSHVRPFRLSARRRNAIRSFRSRHAVAARLPRDHNTTAAFAHGRFCGRWRLGYSGRRQRGVHARSSQWAKTNARAQRFIVLLGEARRQSFTQGRRCGAHEHAARAAV